MQKIARPLSTLDRRNLTQMLPETCRQYSQFDALHRLQAKCRETRRSLLDVGQVPNCLCAPCEGGAFLPVEVRPRPLPVRPRSYGWIAF